MPPRSKTADSDTKPLRSTQVVVKPPINSDRLGLVTGSYLANLDLGTIKKAFNSEAYFSRAVRKYVERFTRNDFVFTGKNPNSVGYVRKRFEQMETVEATPFDMIVVQCAISLFIYGNAFILKVRSINASGGRVYTDPFGHVRYPVAGYFVLDPVYIKPELSESGSIKKWVYSVPGYPVQDFPPRNIMHIKDCPLPGSIYGTPFVYQSIADIQALRRMEELVEILSFQEGMPLYVYTIGNKDSRNVLQKEIDEMSSNISNMAQNGAMVLPWTHKVEVIGSQGKALNVREYLDYFKQRLFSGLGLSALDFGEGDTANRGTATALSEGVIHTVKYYQKLFINAWNKELKNILLEGNWEVTDENKVTLYTAEIDIDTKIKSEQHEMAMYTSNMRQRDRALMNIGDDPVDNEDEFFVNKVQKVLEGYKAEAKVTEVGNPTSKDISRSKTTKNTKTTQKLTPKNQYGKKTGPGSKHNDLTQIAVKIFDPGIDISSIVDELIDQIVFIAHTETIEDDTVIAIKPSEKEFLSKLLTGILTPIRNNIVQNFDTEMDKSIEVMEQEIKLFDTLELIRNRIPTFSREKISKVRQNSFDGELPVSQLTSIFLEK